MPTMGNREDLLTGARHCLYTKGYARTTARDIATEAGTSLAAIGYHFGSVQALLNAAMVQTVSEFADSLKEGRRQAVGDGGPVERLAAVLADTIRHFAEHRQIWLANLEATVAAEHSPELREELLRGLDLGRRGMAAEALAVDEDTVDEELVRTVGAFGMCLVSGLRLQLSIEGDNAPTAEDVIAGMRRVLAP
jgi:AcrR family transcriptional regulator